MFIHFPWLSRCQYLSPGIKMMRDVKIIPQKNTDLSFPSLLTRTKTTCKWFLKLARFASLVFLSTFFVFIRWKLVTKAWICSRSPWKISQHVMGYLLGTKHTQYFGVPPSWSYLHVLLLPAPLGECSSCPQPTGLIIWLTMGFMIYGIKDLSRHISGSMYFSDCYVCNYVIRQFDHRANRSERTSTSNSLVTTVRTRLLPPENKVVN